MKPEIGLIGAGLMGHGIARNILKHGYKLATEGGNTAGVTGNGGGAGNLCDTGFSTQFVFTFDA